MQRFLVWRKSQPGGNPATQPGNPALRRPGPGETHQGTSESQGRPQPRGRRRLRRQRAVGGFECGLRRDDGDGAVARAHVEPLHAPALEGRPPDPEPAPRGLGGREEGDPDRVGDDPLVTQLTTYLKQLVASCPVGEGDVVIALTDRPRLALDRPVVGRRRLALLLLDLLGLLE